MLCFKTTAFLEDGARENDSNESILKQPVRNFQPAQAASKVSSSKLAKKLGISTNEFIERMVQNGYLEVRGKEIGGEFRKSEKLDMSFIWPEELNI